MSHHESEARGADGRMVDRMLFFSDAVFAIVLTIMVLELRPPVLGEHVASTPAALGFLVNGIWHVLFAYLVSFCLVGMWWTIHMRVTRHLKAFDWPSAIANLFFLLTVTLVPFASSVLSETPKSPLGWEIYWGINAIASLGMTVLMFVISRKGGHLIGGMTGRERIARLLQSIGPGLGFGVGAWLASIGEVTLSQNCWLIIMPVMAVARLIYRNVKPEITEPLAAPPAS